MVDLNKIKERLDAQSNKGGSKQNKKENSLFFKVEKPGKVVFRSVAYPHSGENEPFLERHYHFNIPGNYAVYCPEKNDGEECAICRLVWSHMTRLKGNNGQEMQEWRDRLPQLSVMVPGRQLGYYDENDVFVETENAEPKFLKFRSSFEKDREGKTKMSENHRKLYSFFSKDIAWQDWAQGRNLELLYEEPKSGQKTKFVTNAMLARNGGLELSWEKSKGFKNQSEYEEFLNMIPDMDKTDTWVKKTPEEVNKILKKWEQLASEKAEKLMAEAKMSPRSLLSNSDDVIIGGDETVEEEVAQPIAVSEKKQSKNAVTASNIEEKLKRLGY